MVTAPSQGASSGAGATALRVWLGPGNGWSLPVLLGSLAPKVSAATQRMHAAADDMGQRRIQERSANTLNLNPKVVLFLLKHATQATSI